MKTKGKGVSLSQLWKRNAVVAAIALFVCAAVYLNGGGKDPGGVHHGGRTDGGPAGGGLRHCRTGGPDSGHG